MTPNTIRSIAVLSVIALVVAMLPMPYGYYQVLRWVVCLAGLVLGVVRWNDAPYSGSALILTAIIFNPLESITFERSVWLWIDLVSALLFGWVALHPNGDRSTTTG